ncbi:MAG TPA: hypothetical protein VFL69_09610 [Marmoricola sp.]|nr:hypothetical protein [Marmoricola sp.]
MATRTPVAFNQELLDAAQQLVDEYDDLTAGSVLRCYARAVRRSVRTGCPPGRLAREAELLARHMLVARRQRGRVSLPTQSGAIIERGRGAA